MAKNDKTPPKAPTGPKESKVLREEQTYTTKKKSWSILWLPSEFENVGSRTQQMKKGIMVELFQNQEFFPSRFCADILKNPLYKNWKKDEVNAEALHLFLEGYAVERREVQRFEDRVRPQTQIELEEELKDVYAGRRHDQSVIQQQSEQLEDMRKKLDALQGKGTAKA